MPTYPASRDLCTVGGMVANNAGGERSIEFGKTEDFVDELKVVFADGVERVVKPITRAELVKKMAQKDFEGKVYKEIFELCEKHYDEIKAAKPQVSKDSTGYHLWNVWDREKGIFDLTQLIVGSQGTLGLVTDITFRVVPAREMEGMLVLFMKDMNKLGEVIEKVVAAQPSRFESFDDTTLWLSIRFMPSFLKLLGWKKFLRLLISLIPDGIQLLRGIPKLILLITFKGSSEEEIREKIHSLHRSLAKYKARYEINGFEEAVTEGKSEKFWLMRRYSFQLLRSKVKDKHTAPFIDDLVVAPKYLQEFLPRLRKIVKKYKLFATIAGHMGDGNFHIIPLMKLEDPKDRAKILPAMEEVNNLVLRYKGSLSGEHNDGLVRGPWLEEMYGKKVVGYFKRVKEIMDPQNIFNPHKKSDADWDYSFSRIRKSF
jgi:FAD/FMN-containing dehydrogenases